MPELSDAAIPLHLKERFRKEKEDHERRQRELKESHLYASLEIISEADVRAFDRYTSVVDFAPMRPDRSPTLEEGVGVLPLVKVKKAEPIAAVMLQIRERMGLPLHRQRLWLVSTRQNKTTRVDQPLGLPRSREPLGSLIDHQQPSRRERNYHLKLQAGEFLDTSTWCAHLYVEALPEEEEERRVGG